MKASKAASIAIAALGFSALSSQAAIKGYFDVVNVQMADVAYGWICDDANPTATFSTVAAIVVYKNGVYVTEIGASGESRPDTASVCGGYSNNGWSILAWLAPGPIVVYWRDYSGNLHMLPGSPKTCSGPGWCY